MRRRTHLFNNKKTVLIGCLLFALFFLFSCANNTDKPEQKTQRKPVDYIKPIAGTNDSIPEGLAEKGEVLIAYSDCSTCHKEDQRSVGPAFKDIAKRYPINKIYIEMLALKVIRGGNGAWGYPVMDPHPQLSVEDAKLMVTYILSLKFDS